MPSALSRHCSTATAFIDATVLETSAVQIGTFRCPVDYPSFRDTGPIERCVVVFPRTAVWIQHDGSRAFLADPSVATIYNRTQRYERFPASADGDRCDWFGVADHVARDIVSVFHEGDADSDRPFRFERAEVPTCIYLHQRALLRRAIAGTIDRLEAEEKAIELVSSVLRVAYRGSSCGTATRSAARHRALVAAARVELLRSLRTNDSVSDIARVVGTSPYHLCRVFRASTGRTLHEYRTELRVRCALEQLENPRLANNLSAIAHDLGFSSHSHFVRVMRRYADQTPSDVRQLLRACSASRGQPASFR